MHTNEGTANRKKLVSSTSSTGLQHPRTYIWAGPLALSQRMTPPQLKPKENEIQSSKTSR